MDQTALDASPHTIAQAMDTATQRMLAASAMKSSQVQAVILALREFMVQIVTDTVMILSHAMHHEARVITSQGIVNATTLGAAQIA
jgi:hypothetical protein